ncbi:hypothetical protein RB653_002961 [Dictyostelium firmibasis]|uniref:EGF-like domain-containing protein n=1 Tax=Dictyostelium firmibasis TaxID=79012 RepID=A0AAN7YQI1_9MYCE
MNLKLKLPLLITIIIIIFFLNFNESKLLIENKNYRVNDNNVNYIITNDDNSFDFIQYITTGKVMVNIIENGVNSILKEFQCTEGTKTSYNVYFTCEITTTNLTNINSTFILTTKSTNNVVETNSFQINLFYFEDAIQNGYNFLINGKAFLTMNQSLLNFNNNINSKPFKIIKFTNTEIVINTDSTDIISKAMEYNIIYNNEKVAKISLSIEPSIISTQPSYLVNDGDNILINTLGLSNNVSDIEVSILRPDDQWISLNFSISNNNQIKLDNSTIYEYYGERLLRVHLISSNQYSNNYGIVGFAKPILSQISQNFTSLDVFVDCYYLNNTEYPTFLRGLVVTPVSPIGILPTRLIFQDLQFVRGYGYLQCNQSKSEVFKRFYQVMPDLSSWNSIPRKGGVFKFSGKYLLPLNENNERAYTLDLVIINQFTIACENITILKYWGNQEYNASCIVSNYSEPIVETIYITGYLTDSVSTIIKNPFKYLAPGVYNSTSTFFGTPSEVTIYGSSFCMNPNVTIGGKDCPVRLSDYQNDRIYCSFESDIEGLTITHTINVTCGNEIGLGDVFLYATDECLISRNTTGIVCSGNGICDNSIRKCICNDNYFGLDCSIKNNGSIVPPIIDNTTSIIDIDNSKFEIGLVQIRETEFIGETQTKVYNLTGGIWNLESVNQMKTNYIFNTTLENQATIKVYLTINSDSKLSKQYNFYGDNITILPNSVKYQIEITNWTFDNSLNSVQLIFQSKLSIYQCNDSETLVGNKTIQMYGDSIRSMELTLTNGQTLIGTFSSRMKLDDRVIKSSIKILDEQQSIGIPKISDTKSNTSSLENIKTSTQIVYTAVSINYFRQIAIVDPSFGVLIQSDLSSGGGGDILDECGKVIGKKKENLANWKIALIVVFSVVGISLIVIGVIVFKTRNRNSVVVNGVKLKMNKEN